jgi:hypothetical protein
MTMSTTLFVIVGVGGFVALVWLWCLLAAASLDDDRVSRDWVQNHVRNDK